MDTTNCRVEKYSRNIKHGRVEKILQNYKENTVGSDNDCLNVVVFLEGLSTEMLVFSR